jgi:hypothetical protein
VSVKNKATILFNDMHLSREKRNIPLDLDKTNVFLEPQTKRMEDQFRVDNESNLRTNNAHVVVLFL